MGSMITLGLGKLEIDWGKNSFFNNYSKLYLPSDVTTIPYYYADNIIEEKEGYSRKLKNMVLRLELLGYTNESLRGIYTNMYNNFPEANGLHLSFDELLDILLQIDVSGIQLEDESGDYDLGEYASEFLFKQNEFLKNNVQRASINRDFGAFLEHLDPCLLLRILANNPSNAELEVQWRYADVLENGWTTKENIHEGLGNYQKYLIVTEGSSDSFIIYKSLKLLKPEVLDFFYFVDMEEQYPFTGTGNLYKFCQGLASINIQNNVIIIYDNDAAGIEKFMESSRLKLPQNMRIMKLPNHYQFDEYNTIGPNGESFENVNGKAVSIELFLDLEHNGENKPVVRWKSYNEKLNCYQGELINKTKYVRDFKKIKTTDVNYNLRLMHKSSV